MSLMIRVLILFLVTSFIGGQATASVTAITGNYITEYEVFCEEKVIDWIEKPCTRKGAEYTFAVANTKNASDAIASLVTENTWIGAHEKKYGNTYSWTWESTPRQAAIRFGGSSKCDDTASYCNYEAGRPDDGKDCGDKFNDYLMMHPDGTWRDVSLYNPSPRQGTKTDCYPIKCYACQRSLCVISDRCVVSNTNSAYGYLSFSGGTVGTEGCICQCKEGYGGDRCQYTLVDSNSTFQVSCVNSSSISITEAQRACTGVGTGWTLGTMSSEAVKEYMMNNTTEGVWLAGRYINATDNWVWNTGRRTSEPIAFENWASDYPSRCDGDSDQLFLGTNNQGKFIGLRTNSTCNASNASGTETVPHCALCEYQPCSIELDCTPSSTVTVSGYYGNCRCICEEGWGGSRCSVPNVVEGNGYNTSYFVFCNYGQCSSENNMIDATIPNENVNNLLQKLLVASEKPSMLRLEVTTFGDTLSWKSDLRRRSKKFWTSSGCLEGAYCNFGPTTSGAFIVMLANGTWNRTAEYTECHACEKSLCQLDIDCFKPGSIRVTGYYPKCVCQCKEGYSGFQCATFDFQINTTNHLSNYTAICGDSTGTLQPISITSARSRCSTIGGADLATMDDNETLAAFLEKINGTEDDTFWWLGGSSTTAEPEKWYWNTGRLNRTLFYDGTSNNSTNWAMGYPLNNHSGNSTVDGCPSDSRQDALIIGKDGQWRNIYSNIKCNSYTMQPHCVLCEKPLCVLQLDCEEDNAIAVSGTYGNCVCQCKDGWGGKRCDMRAIIYNETYSTEYIVKCSSSEIRYRWNANSQCRQLGEGWTLASVPNIAVNNLLKTMITRPVWLAGSYGYNYAIRGYRWVWDGDIRVPSVFGTKDYGYGYSLTNKCIDGAFCNFDSTDTCTGSNLAMDTTGKWASIAYSYYSYSSCTVPSCVACERSACNITQDCFADGTLNATGWYPSCSCLCKPGFTGVLCDTFLFNATNDNYTSMYHLKCQNSHLSVEEAKAYCRSLGSQYNLASLPTANASDAFTQSTNITSFHFWLGAHAVDGIWMWTTGRQAGVPLSNGYTNWRDGRPRAGDTCSDENSSWLVVESPGGNWSDEYFNGTECSSNMTVCVACEALPCELHLDCNVTHTLSVDGYFGNCRCQCADGWGGPTCSLINVIHSPTYSTEYSISCSETPLSGYRYSMNYQCYRQGNGWTPASVPSSQVQDLLTQLVEENTWLGAERYSSYRYYGTVEWKWEYGRMKGTIFANSTNCTTSSCYFPIGRPTKNGECVYSYWYHINNMVIMLPNGTWHDRYESQKSTNGPGCFPARCVACERSPCSILADCNPNGTVNATGWYSSCMCHCKAGYSGERCEIYTVQNNHYKSQYKLVCSDEPLTRYSAKLKCDDEWFVATTPTANATEALELLSSMYGNATNRIWLAASDEEVEGDWQWRAGRLTSTQLGDNYSLWASGRPANDTVCGGQTTDYLVLVNQSVWEDTYFYSSYPGPEYNDCPTPPRCVACERQPCLLEVDCVSANTESVSGWFPSCTCKCFSGWGGQRCNVSSLVEHFNYVSEYAVTCERKTCYSLDGDGWETATVPSAKANDVLSQLSEDSLLLGATVSYDTNEWRWSTGRQKGVAFSVAATEKGKVGSVIGDVYSNWGAGQPMYSCYNSYYSYYGRDRHAVLVAGGNRSWATYGSYSHYDSSCPTYSCHACERSPCSIAVDCTVNNTESVSGYYPNCKCKCKFGYAGENCSYDGSFSETRPDGAKDYYTLFVECDSYSVTYSSAKWKCGKLGEGWALATPYSVGYHMKLLSLARKKLQALNIQSRFWLGGEKVGEKWEWKYGRATGKEINVENCPNYDSASFCMWPETQTNEFCFGDGMTLDTKGLGSWSIAEKGYSSINSCGNPPKCYACQQSNCTLDVDCDRTHALNVSGMYPECSCECEAGWGGARCGDRVCHVATDCHNLSDAVTGTWPHCYCTGCPKGRGPWGCATLTSTLPLDPKISRTTTVSPSRTTGRPVPVTKSTTLADRTTTEENISSDTVMTNATEEPSGDNMTSESVTTTTTTDGDINTTTASDTTTNASESTTNASDVTSATEADENTTSNATEIPSFTTETNTTITTTAAGDCFNETCSKEAGGYTLVPLPHLHSPLSADALQSSGSINITVSIRIDVTSSSLRGYFVNATTNEEITMLQVKTVMNRDSVIIMVVAQPVPSGKAYFQLESADIIKQCCGNTEQHHRFVGTSSNNVRLFSVELEAAKEVGSPKEDKAQQDVLQNNAGERDLMSGSVSYGCEVLYGKPNNDAVLRALSPVALLVSTDDGYSGILYSNLIVIVIVLVIHFIVVMVQRARTHCPFAEVCASLSFPSMPLYVIYALLPGTAIASSELTAKGSGLGVVSMLVTLGIILNAALYPYLYLSRGLYSVPLVEGKQRGAGYSLIFPTTIVAPPAVAASHGAFINNYRFPSPVWPTLPLWSSLSLLVLSLVQPTSTTACTSIYVILAVIHMIIILVVMIARPHTSLLLDIAYCAGIFPVVLLGATRATSAEDAAYAMLILLAAVNALRLGAAFCSPFKTFRLASYENITHEAPLWVFNSKCGKEFEGFSDLETAMFTFKEDDHYADPSLMFKDNMSSVSGQSGQPGSVVDMPYAPPNRSHTLAPGEGSGRSGGSSDHHSASEPSPGVLSPDKGSAVGSEVDQQRNTTEAPNDVDANSNENGSGAGPGTVETAPNPMANGDEDPFE